MYDNYNYPMGADNPDAPWNEKEIEEIPVKLWINASLVKEVIVMTDNYSVERDEEFGGADIELHDSNADILDYYRSQRNSITKLLSELAKYINVELMSSNITPSRRRELEDMYSDCEGWDEEVTIEDYELA